MNSLRTSDIRARQNPRQASTNQQPLIKQVSNSDAVYVNCSITGNRTDDAKLAVYNVTYDQAIIDRPSDYFLSVAKFTIPLENIPILTMPIYEGNEPPPTYRVGTASQGGNTVTGIGTNFTEDMAPSQLNSRSGSIITWDSGQTAVITQWNNSTDVTVDVNQVVPNGPYTIEYGANQDLTKYTVGLVQNNYSPPYPVWTPFPRPVRYNFPGTPGDAARAGGVQRAVFVYEHFARMVTTALEKSWQDAGSPGTTAPTFIWDNLNGRFSFTVNTTMFNAGWTVYFNTDFLAIVRGFDTFFVPDPVESRYQLIIDPSARLIPSNATAGLTLTGAGWDPLFNTVVDTMVIPPSYTSLEYFTSLRRILIVSNSLPAQKEYFPVIGAGTQTGLANTLGVIADFQIDTSQIPGSVSGLAQFDVQQVLPIDLLSDAPLRKIDFQLFWTDTKNNLYPISVPKEQAVLVKLAFLNKQLLIDQHVETETL